MWTKNQKNFTRELKKNTVFAKKCQNSEIPVYHRVGLFRGECIWKTGKKTATLSK